MFNFSLLSKSNFNVIKMFNLCLIQSSNPEPNPEQIVFSKLCRTKTHILIKCDKLFIRSILNKIM
jgi:hypothetical protein